MYLGEEMDIWRQTGMPKKSKMKRFTVSLEPAEYEELVRMAESHRPPLSLQYVVRYVLQIFLEENNEKQLSLNFN